ncbi:GH20132 [Drosophila grimshawi]|uniref:GH20132 n=1 Tax=Drosophila grimshawi TaxID=7222 RepID=B4J6T8_DROGR|nr:GH20132 [Drosophila grimshawi]
MNGGGDNQLTVHYNHRPINRRLQMILQDLHIWQQPPVEYYNPIETLQGDPVDNGLMNAEGILPRSNTDVDDSGFESGSESDML